MLIIRRARSDDWPGIYPILKEVVYKGDTYAIEPASSEAELRELWLEHPTATFSALLDNEIVGTYYLKTNQPGGGSHVCNAGYMVSMNRRGRGIGRALCANSLETALEMGYEAMQYNLVVSSNHVAIRLWQSMGFKVVGILPKAFRHPDHGLVDACVMYRLLKPTNSEAGDLNNEHQP